MADNPVSLTKAAALKTKRVVKEFLGETEDAAGRKGMRFPEGMLRYAVLTEDLAVASDMETGATTATAQLKKKDRSTGDLVDAREIEVVNRSIDASPPSGTMVIVAKINGEWAMVWADCD